MRIYEICLFVVAINVGFLMINNLAIFQTQSMITPDIGLLKAVNKTKEDPYFSSAILGPVISQIFIFGDFLGTLTRVVTFLVNIPAAPGQMLEKIGFPWWISGGLTTIISLVYIAGLWQFIANRSFKIAS